MMMTNQLLKRKCKARRYFFSCGMFIWVSFYVPLRNKIFKIKGLWTLIEHTLYEIEILIDNFFLFYFIFLMKHLRQKVEKFYLVTKIKRKQFSIRSSNRLKIFNIWKLLKPTSSWKHETFRYRYLCHIFLLFLQKFSYMISQLIKFHLCMCERNGNWRISRLSMKNYLASSPFQSLCKISYQQCRIAGYDSIKKKFNKTKKKCYKNHWKDIAKFRIITAKWRTCIKLWQLYYF